MYVCAKYWIIVLLFFAKALSAQPWAAEDLHDDLDTLVARLERYQPRFYHYHEPLQFEQRLQTTKARLQDSVTALQWFAAVHYLLAAVGEGHLQIGEAQDDWYRGFADGRFQSFPLTVYYWDHSLFVLNNYSDQEHWTRGDQLLTINGYTIDSLRQIFHDHSLADGHILSSRDQGWQGEFSARYYWLVEQPDSFIVTYRPKGSTTIRQAVLPALSMLDMAQWAQKRDQIPERPMGLDALYSLTQQGERATLRLRSFELADWRAYDLDPAIFYQALFKRLRQNHIQCLILDLRGNKGGERSFIDDCLPYLPLHPNKQPYQSYYNAQGQRKDYYLPKRNRYAFRGKLIILIDGETYSSAALLAQYASRYGGATLMGAEAGSRVAGFAGGTQRLIYLPHSNTAITIPTAQVEHVDWPEATTDVQRGLMPDIVVPLPWSAVSEGKDPVMERALEECGL